MGIYTPSKAISGLGLEKIKNYSTYKKIFNINTPNVQNIIDLQKDYANTCSKNIIDKETINKINNDLNYSNNNSSNIEIDNIITELEKLDYNFFQLRNKLNNKSLSLPDLSVYYKDIINSFDAPDRLKPSIASLEKVINEIDRIINDNRIIDKNRYFLNRSLNNKSLVRILSGVGSSLVGYKFELLAIEAISHYVPNVYQAGDVTFGNKQIDIKEDLAVFIEKNMTFTMLDGNKKTLSEIKQNSNKTINLNLIDEEEYKKFQEAMKYGIQAKRVKGMTSLHTGLTTSNILNNINNLDSYYWQLYHLWQLKKQNSIQDGDVENLDLYVDYNMSKILNKIFGKNNLFFVYPHNLITTEDFILKILKNNNYITTKPSSLTVPMRVKANFHY